MRYLLVRWRDCTTNTDSFELSEAARHELIPVETVGHLIAEHDDRIILASEYFETEQTCRHLFVIPRVNIDALVELRLGGTPKSIKTRRKKGRVR